MINISIYVIKKCNEDLFYTSSLNLNYIHFSFKKKILKSFTKIKELQKIFSLTNMNTQNHL